jgi:hypothetical protein
MTVRNAALFYPLESAANLLATAKRQTRETPNPKQAALCPLGHHGRGERLAGDGQ